MGIPERKYDTFPELKDYPFGPNYVEIKGYQIHYIDEGPQEAIPILLLHGVPTWSYLFRKMIPLLLAAGHRVLAPDLLGFGKSDKPSKGENYSFDYLNLLLQQFIERLNLQHIVLLGHDWGAILGLRLAVENEPRFLGIVICNGYLPRASAHQPFFFRAWKMFTKYAPYLPVGWLVSLGSSRKLSRKERQAYDLPFKHAKHKRPIRTLPQLLPFKKKEPDFNTAQDIWRKLEVWNKPFLSLFGRDDPIGRDGPGIIKKYVPGAQNQDHKLFIGGHFLPEDTPHEMSEMILRFIKENRFV